MAHCYTSRSACAIRAGPLGYVRRTWQAIACGVSRGYSVECKAGLLTSLPRTTEYQPSSSQPTVRSFSSADLDDDEPRIAYEVVQGSMVRWTRQSTQAPKTAVLVHGILGSRRNMQSFARMLAEGFPAWQILLVDLRCHGESAASISSQLIPPHNVASAAADILILLRDLKLFPHVLIGHSFGGKVVMDMVRQFGAAQLPRPVQVWVLDSLPGEVRSGEADGRDHPGRLIDTLRAMPMPVSSRNAVVDYLSAAGFSQHIARWAATNLRPAASSNGSGQQLEWSFDLDGIADMYRSYEGTHMWSLLQQPPQGLKLDFVKAEGSNFRWGGEDEAMIKSLGHPVHLLRNAGHWVHTDNPMGLFDILAPSLGEVDLRQRRPSPTQFQH